MNDDTDNNIREQLLRSDEVREMVSMRAYEIFVNRGGEPGREAEDWFQAEHEIVTILIEEENRLTRARSRITTSEEATDDSADASPPIDSRPPAMQEGHNALNRVARSKKGTPSAIKKKSKSADAKKKDGKKKVKKAESKSASRKPPIKKEKK